MSMYYCSFLSRFLLWQLCYVLSWICNMAVVPYCTNGVEHACLWGVIYMCIAHKHVCFLLLGVAWTKLYDECASTILWRVTVPFGFGCREIMQCYALFIDPALSCIFLKPSKAFVECQIFVLSLRKNGFFASSLFNVKWNIKSWLYLPTFFLRKWFRDR